MEATCVLERSVPEEYGHVLNATMVYQDPLTQKWATQVCDRVTHLVGQDCMHSTSWSIGDLTRPRIFPEAVQSAIMADIIVVSAYATEELPLDLYVWIDAWLPRRHQHTGALVALLGVPDRPLAHSSHPQEYLRAVAQRGRLDFLPQERKLALESIEFQMDKIAQRVSTTTQVLSGILHGGEARYRGWGINE